MREEEEEGGEQQGQTVRRREREVDEDEVKERGECGLKRKGWRQREGSYR